MNSGSQTKLKMNCFSQIDSAFIISTLFIHFCIVSSAAKAFLEGEYKGYQAL